MVQPVLGQQVALVVCRLAHIVLADCAVWSLCGVKGQPTGFLLVFPMSLGQGDYSGWLFRLLYCRRGHLVPSGQQAGGLAQCLGALQGSPLCAVDSSLVSSTTGRFSVSANWVVLVSSFSSGPKGGFGEARGDTIRSGSVLAPGTCGGMSTTAIS